MARNTLTRGKTPAQRLLNRKLDVLEKIEDIQTKIAYHKLTIASYKRELIKLEYLLDEED